MTAQHPIPALFRPDHVVDANKMVPHNGTAPSIAAAKVAATTATQKRDKLLAAYRNAGVRGMTDEEAEAATGIAGNTIRPRRGELMSERFGEVVVDSGHQRPTRSGCMATVYVAKEYL